MTNDNELEKRIRDVEEYLGKKLGRGTVFWCTEIMDGLILLQKGKLVEAVKLFQQGLKKDPIKAYSELIKYFRCLKSYFDAAETPKEYENLGIWLGKEFEGYSENTLNELLKLKPKTYSDYCVLSDALSSHKRFNEAIDAAKKAIDLDPKKDTAYECIGRCFYMQNEFEKAEEMFEKALELSPFPDYPNHTAFLILKEIYTNQNREEKIAALYKRYPKMHEMDLEFEKEANKRLDKFFD